eukprot:2683815-Rhodomonas_salina.6
MAGSTIRLVSTAHGLVVYALGQYRTSRSQRVARHQHMLSQHRARYASTGHCIASAHGHSTIRYRSTGHCIASA